MKKRSKKGSEQISGKARKPDPLKLYKEALAQQAATSEILKVIANSPSDVQPVFDAILESATRLCDAHLGVLNLYDGESLRTVARRSGNPEFAKWVLERGAFKPAGILARVIGEKRTIQISDLRQSPAYLGGMVHAVKFVDLAGARSYVAVPLVKDHRALGAFGIYRREVRPFTDQQVELLESFASQAVIAIENVRLFNETKEALEQQTATAEILKAISNSPTDVQPVLDAVARRSAVLCESMDARVFLVDGEVARYVAGFGEFAGVRGEVPMTRGSVVARAIIDRSVVHVEDLSLAWDEFPDAPVQQAKYGHRTTMGVPLMRENKAIGGILLRRREVRSYSGKQIDLIKLFADQAVIAIENVRLFNETKEALEQQTATAEILKAISGSPTDVRPVFEAIVRSGVRLFKDAAVAVARPDGNMFRLMAIAEHDRELAAGWAAAFPFPVDRAYMHGAAVLDCAMVEMEDAQKEDARFPLGRRNFAATGYRAMTVVPMVKDGVAIGTVSVVRAAPGPLSEKQKALLRTFADQAVIAIENVRLFRELEEKGRQLEEASRHKSDFLSSMSHELRTPLNAILGFNEMILGQIYGEVPKDMQEPLQDIQKSGKHLLRLINNVLDLAKIEAGRMELALSDYSVQDTVESVRSTLRPLAAEKGLEFLASVPEVIPLAYGDGGRIAQCLMNLAGNSLKFTKAGKVEISVAEKDGRLTYRVADTGVGIPPDKIGGLFTEFKQTDATIASEYGGTGLGLSISRKFVEMHGGRIWVESELGRGSTFIFELPLRVQTA